MYQQRLSQIIEANKDIVGNHINVSFRQLVPEIPSTTYGTFGLYRYPAKFIPQIIASILNSYCTREMSVLDPFAGCGTTGLVARIYGHNYELWDLNPMLKVLHSIAIMKPIEIDTNYLIRQITNSKRNFEPSWNNLSYWFPERVLPLLFKVWGFFHDLDDPKVKKLLLIPLLKTTRFFSYNDPQRQKLSRSPISFKRVETLLEIDWETKFYEMVHLELNNVIRRINEYQELLPYSDIKAVIRAGLDVIDYSSKLKDEPNNRWDVLITSPPYLQAQEYIRNSKLDLFWLGYTEEAIRQLSKRELPYNNVDPIPIYSETYYEYLNRIEEHHMQGIYKKYFFSVLCALTNLSKFIDDYLFLFVGSASIRSIPIPIDKIFAEHFKYLGWKHEWTLIDSIASRVMFKSEKNPATGLKDNRITKEKLVVLKRGN